MSDTFIATVPKPYWSISAKLFIAGLANMRHAAFTAVPDIFIYFPRPSSLHCEEYVCIYTCVTVYRLCTNYRCYQITLQWNIFTQIESGAKCWLDIYHWGANLVVTGPIRDIGQNVVQSYFQKGSSSSPPPGLLPNFVPYLIPRGDLC